MAQIKVRYVGIGDERIISKKDLSAAGVEVDQDLSWNRGNLFALDIEATDKLEELLKAEGHFKISTSTDDADEKTLVVASNPDGEGDVLEDGNTGATTATKGSKAK